MPSLGLTHQTAALAPPSRIPGSCTQGRRSLLIPFCVPGHTTERRELRWHQISGRKLGNHRTAKCLVVVSGARQLLPNYQRAQCLSVKSCGCSAAGGSRFWFAREWRRATHRAGVGRGERVRRFSGAKRSVYHTGARLGHMGVRCPFAGPPGFREVALSSCEKPLGVQIGGAE